jgi:ABC-type Mn2+/Zn2+ transport system ATPase subunit
LSPALLGSALLLLTMLGCYVMISVISYHDQQEATAMEMPMKVTKMVRMQKIGTIATLGILNTVASVVAATSG